MVVIALVENIGSGTSVVVTPEIENQAIAEIKDLIRNNSDDVRFLLNLHQSTNSININDVHVVIYISTIIYRYYTNESKTTLIS